MLNNKTNGTDTLLQVLQEQAKMDDLQKKIIVLNTLIDIAEKYNNIKESNYYSRQRDIALIELKLLEIKELERNLN